MTATTTTEHHDETTRIGTNHGSWALRFAVVIVIGLIVWGFYLAGTFRVINGELVVGQPNLDTVQERIRTLRDRMSVAIRGVPYGTVIAEQVSADGLTTVKVIKVVNPTTKEEGRIRVTTQQLAAGEPDFAAAGVAPARGVLSSAPDTAPRAPVAGGCKVVKIERADTDATTSTISVRFRTEVRPGTVVGFTDCMNATPANVLEKTTDPEGGLKVRLSLSGGIAQIAVPNSFVQGTADQVVCSKSGDVISHQKYAASWSTSIPDTIRLQRLDSYDRAKADAGCKAIAS